MKDTVARFSFLIFLIFTTNIFSQPPQIVQLVNQVNKDSIALFIRQLSGDTSCVIGGSSYTIVSRHKNQPGNDKAAQFIFEKFQSWGYQVQYETFSSTGKNVVATKQGSNDSQAYFVVCAHYDDMPSGTTAPGADDNASGTATVLELARVFSKFNSNYTIKFICFDEEEQGLVGSNYYATQARNRNDSIIGVINLDMTAYDANNDGMVDVHSTNVANTAQIANEWINNIYQYGISLTPRTVASQPYSDHYSFQQKNYGAILIIEYDLEFNPRYHTVNDKFQYLNINFAHKIAQVSAATAAEYIQVVSTNSVTIFVSSGWNLLSIPIQPNDGRKSALFPNASSFAYTFDGNYLVKDTLEIGKGYWLKFNSSQNQIINGQLVSQLQIPLKQGWNLIGTLNGTIPVSSIITSPPNIISSLFYEYNGAYNPSQQLEKGKGYWVKSSQNGSMTIALSGKTPNDFTNTFKDFEYTLIFKSQDKIQKLYLTEKNFNREFFELPPEPPQGSFDVRFSNNCIVNNLNEKESIITIQSDIYPVEMAFDAKEKNPALKLIIDDNGIEKEFFISSGEKFLINGNTSHIKIKKENLLDKFTLLQNYPNPFNPNTTIQFYVKEKSKVILSVYNLQGQVIKLLINKELEKGFYSVDFDGSEFPSGVYFYELKANDFRDIKKMMLLK